MLKVMIIIMTKRRNDMLGLSGKCFPYAKYFFVKKVFLIILFVQKLREITRKLLYIYFMSFSSELFVTFSLSIFIFIGTFSTYE